MREGGGEIMKLKKIIALGLATLTLTAVSLESNLISKPEAAYAQTYHKGALLVLSVKKTAKAPNWYTRDNFNETLTRTFNGYSYTYHLTNLTYSSKNGYNTTTAHYSID